MPWHAVIIVQYDNEIGRRGNEENGVGAAGGGYVCIGGDDENGLRLPYTARYTKPRVRS